MTDGKVCAEKKKTGAPKTAQREDRDAYDDFLELTMDKSDAGNGRGRASSSGSSRRRRADVGQGVGLSCDRKDRRKSPGKKSKTVAGEMSANRKKPAFAQAPVLVKVEQNEIADLPEEMADIPNQARNIQPVPSEKDGVGTLPETGKQEFRRAQKAQPARETVSQDDIPKRKRKPSSAEGKPGQSSDADRLRPRPDNGGDDVEKRNGTPRKKRSAEGGASKTAAEKKASNGEGTARRKKAVAGSGKRKSASGKALLHVENRQERDGYDEFLEQTEWKAPKRRVPVDSRQIGILVALIVCFVCMFGLAGWQCSRYADFRKMKNVVQSQNFYKGTSVEGIDVSDMTLQEALDYWAKNIEARYAQTTVSLSNGTVLSAQDVGYYSDYQTVLTNAWNAGRTGTLEERYGMISQRMQQPVSYSVTRAGYSEDMLAAQVRAVAASVDEPAQNAKIQSFNTETYEFVFSDEVPGRAVDTEQLSREIIQTLEQGGGRIQLRINSVEPSLKKADIAGQYGMISSAVTNASSSSSNRLTNIKLSMDMINGYCLEPGETFSFNDVVGKRTRDRGFKVATAYASGEVTEDVGGGVCQVSTTLFNAAVKADMRIDERHHHSLTVGYVDRGKDAAVSWTSQDLKFTNAGDDSVYICCVVDGEKRVRIAFFGKLLPNGESITLEGDTTGTINYETVYQPNVSLMPGTTNVIQKGRTGYTAEAYKVRWDANGNKISNELLCKSSYKAINEIVEYCP